MSKSSFIGKILEIPGIAVDNFEEPNLHSQAYFLSHCHTDHTNGLFSDNLADVLSQHENVYIYASELTKAVIADSGICKVLDRIKPLSLGSIHLTLPKCFGHEKCYLRVTLIQAGHCLGSVMFLFETSNTTVLYTGDFNLSCNDIKHVEPLHRNKQPIYLDAIYIDTTFINVNSFPKRSAVVNELIEIIRKYLTDDDNNRIGLNVSAKYGYEYVFNEIYSKLGLKVYVNDSRWSFYKQNPTLCKGITNDEEQTKIHLCAWNSPANHQKCFLTKFEGLNFIVIRFSAMPWKNFEYDGIGIKWEENNKKLNVCFATHSSRTQIIEFVNYFPHKRVIGFPNEFLLNKPVHSSDAIVVSPKKRKLETKVCVNSRNKDQKVERSVLNKMFS